MVKIYFIIIQIIFPMSRIPKVLSKQTDSREAIPIGAGRGRIFYSLASSCRLHKRNVVKATWLCLGISLSELYRMLLWENVRAWYSSFYTLGRWDKQYSSDPEKLIHFSGSLLYFDGFGPFWTFLKSWAGRNRLFFRVSWLTSYFNRRINLISNFRCNLLNNASYTLPNYLFLQQHQQIVSAVLSKDYSITLAMPFATTAATVLQDSLWRLRHSV